VTSEQAGRLSARLSAIYADLSGGDPQDDGTAARVAYYEARANEGIAVMVDPGTDRDRRANAEDMATEAMYRAMLLRRREH
jgi:transcriptional/translational regulatory protein YebC/TACO1